MNIFMNELQFFVEKVQITKIFAMGIEVVPPTSLGAYFWLKILLLVYNILYFVFIMGIRSGISFAMTDQ